MSGRQGTSIEWFQNSGSVGTSVVWGEEGGEGGPYRRIFYVMVRVKQSRRAR